MEECESMASKALCNLPYINILPTPIMKYFKYDDIFNMSIKILNIINNNEYNQYNDTNISLSEVHVIFLNIINILEKKMFKAKYNELQLLMMITNILENNNNLINCILYAYHHKTVKLF